MNLKKLRNENNLTLDQLSKEVEISNPLLSNYEQGKVNPPIKNLFKLADYFEVSIDYLLGHQTKDTIWTDGMTETQKKLVEIVKMLTPAQASFALGYFSDMLGLTYSQVKPTRPF